MQFKRIIPFIFSCAILANASVVLAQSADCPQGPALAETQKKFDALFENMRGLSGMGSIGSSTCQVKNPCIGIYLENEETLAKLNALFPRGIVFDGVSAEFTVIGQIGKQ